MPPKYRYGNLTRREMTGIATIINHVISNERLKLQLAVSLAEEFSGQTERFNREDFLQNCGFTPVLARENSYSSIKHGTIFTVKPVVIT